MKRDLNNDSVNYAVNEWTRRSIYFIGGLGVILISAGLVTKTLDYGGKEPKAWILKVLGMLLILSLPVARLFLASTLLFIRKEILYGILALVLIALSFAAVLLKPLGKF